MGRVCPSSAEFHLRLREFITPHGRALCINRGSAAEGREVRPLAVGRRTHPAGAMPASPHLGDNPAWGRPADVGHRCAWRCGHLLWGGVGGAGTGGWAGHWAVLLAAPHAAMSSSQVNSRWKWRGLGLLGGGGRVGSGEPVLSDETGSTWLVWPSKGKESRDVITLHKYTEQVNTRYGKAPFKLKDCTGTRTTRFKLPNAAWKLGNSF